MTVYAHICDERLKLDGINFHDMSFKYPNLYMNSQTTLPNLHYTPLPPIKLIIHTYENPINAKRKYIPLFGDSIPKYMRMKD